tara:strand:+ start:372 stop:2570 length:2199 start_codon:yes stop_codon:yes gene_type:complete
MADTKLKVQIQFQATGDKELARAFKTASIANEKLEKANKKLTKQNERYGKGVFDITKKNRLLANSFATIRSKLLLASFAIGLVSASFGKLVQQSMQFEKVKVRLNAMFGSVQRGTEAFNAFNKIAATTPFTLQDIVEAGASLKAFGADSERLIKPVSDLAAFMGTTATEAAQALGRAFAGGAGAADILRERGILQLVRDSQGIEDLSKITLPEFREALEKTITDPSIGIAGATDALSKTMTGMVSNLQDSFVRLSAALGDSIIFFSGAKKIIPALTDIFSNLTEAITRFNETDQETFLRLISEFSDADTIQKFSDAFEVVPSTFDKVSDALDGTESIMNKFIKTSNVAFDSGFYKDFTDTVNTAVVPVMNLGTALDKTFISGALSSQQGIERLTKFLNEMQLEVDIQRALLTRPGRGGTKADIAQLDVLRRVQESIIKPLQELLPKAVKEADPVAINLDDLVTFDEDEEDVSISARLVAEEARNRSALASALMETANLVQEAEGLIVQTREDLFQNHFNKILNLAQQNINQRKNAELQALRDTDAFRNASAEERADMEKDALKRFREQEQIIFRINQAVEIAKVVMNTKSAMAQIQAVMAQIQAQAALLQANPITAPFAKKALAQIPMLTATMGNLKASSAMQIMGIAAQKPPAFARGGSFVTQGQQMIMVGDNAGGRERVDITPLSTPDFGDAGGGASINVNIMGNVIGTQEFVRDNLLPEIENTIKRNLA